MRPSLAREAIRAARSNVNESDGTMRPDPGFVTSVSKARRISSALWTDAWNVDTLKPGAAASIDCIHSLLYGDVSGLNSTAICTADGATSLSNCSHLRPTSGS